MYIQNMDKTYSAWPNALVDIIYNWLQLYMRVATLCLPHEISKAMNLTDSMAIFSADDKADDKRSLIPIMHSLIHESLYSRSPAALTSAEYDFGVHKTWAKCKQDSYHYIKRFFNGWYAPFCFSMSY
jgi:hypothetical protein